MRRVIWVTLSIATVAVVVRAVPSATADPGVAPPELPPQAGRSLNSVELPSPPQPDLPDEAASRAAEALDGTAPARPVIAGYTGDRWAEREDGTVSVLADTVAVRDGVATGLVRNGTSEPVGPVTVSAGEATATVPVPVLRPGEPAPFVLELPPGTTPAEVELTVDALPAADEPVRDLALATFWERGVTDPRPVDTYLYTDPASGPQPRVALGSVQAVRDVEGLVVVAAWIADDGRVLAVDPAARLQATALAAGGAGDFLVEATGPEELDDAILVLWGSGS